MKYRKNILNWSLISRTLTGYEHHINANYSGKMYKEKVARLIRIEKAIKEYIKSDKF